MGKRTTGMVAYALAAAWALAGCGGGGDTSSGRTYNTVGGAVQLNLVNNQSAGLPAGLVLSDGNESYTVPAGATSFAFPTGLGAGETYNVTVVNSPTGLNCAVTAPSGTMARSAVNNVQVSCSDVSVQMSGYVSGMQSGGAVQLSNGTDTIVVTASTLPGVGGNNPVSYTSSCTAGPTPDCFPNATWAFPHSLPFGTPYSVQVQGQSLVQCALGNGAGTVGPTRVDNILVSCTLPQLGILAGKSFGNSGNVNNGGNINTGTGTANAAFWYPYDVVPDAAGNLYVADGWNNLIRKIDPVRGSVTTIAGFPRGGYVDGLGTAAGFNIPRALAVDATGTLYVADTLNNVIRKITSSGQVSTFAGTGYGGSADGPAAAATFLNPAGIALDALSGNVYVADTLNNTIRMITPGTNGSSAQVSTFAGAAYPATFGFVDDTGAAARFKNPQAVALDSSGNVYVADTGNNAIRKITPGGVVSTFATVASPYAANGIAVDLAGKVYLSTGSTIRVFAPDGTVISDLAGSPTAPAGSTDGAGAAASFRSTQGISVDAAGNVYVADLTNNTIRKITPAGLVTTAAGQSDIGSSNGLGTGASFNVPMGIALDSTGNVYLADSGNFLIRRINPAGVVTTVAGTVGTRGSVNATGTNASFQNPSDVALDAAGNIYVLDNMTIRKINPAGVVSTFVSVVPVGGVVGMPSAISVDPSSGNIVVALAGFRMGSGVLSITPSGVMSVLMAGGMQNTPEGVAVDASGTVYVADFGMGAVLKISPTGVVSTVVSRTGWGGASVAPHRLALDAAGNLYVLDQGQTNNRIWKITPAGTVKSIAGTAGSNVQLAPSNLPGAFQTPNGIALSQPDPVTGHYNLYFTTGNALAEIVNVDVY